MNVIARKSRIVFTIGHSTHTIDEFIDTLGSYKVKKIIDVRTIPRSRHNPQFNKETLPGVLSGASVGYLHMPGRGGLRHPKKDSPNEGWRNSSFRGFADYMQTPDFKKNIDRLIKLADKKPLALMCAEAVPWRCHRLLIADALKARGIEVEHIIGPNASRHHEFTPWAKIDGMVITYPLEKEAVL